MTTERRMADRRIDPYSSGSGGKYGLLANNRRKADRRYTPNIRNCTFVTDGGTEAGAFYKTPTHQVRQKERRIADRRMNKNRIAELKLWERRMSDRRVTVQVDYQKGMNLGPFTNLKEDRRRADRRKQ